jgi:hypothetical protein
LTRRIAPETEAFGKATFAPVTLERFEEVVLETPAGVQRLKARAQATDLWGADHPFQHWA